MYQLWVEVLYQPSTIVEEILSENSTCFSNFAAKMESSSRFQMFDGSPLIQWFDDPRQTVLSVTCFLN
ncbi:hypothetical protein Pan153_27200 [Gimesia panareensis]|uniref:Uncharacterized protein n=1 Tax=Gimesia panareensis TaxID=2527978 RepID=A0A518FNZ5_9PLAN|nr:hypothetical protein Pan153_27200 [Gimesia panareensis]